ncbi:50S ribosomal protein L7ae-like protein [Spiroplasma endosymbiont of Labia minor]|uniref:50S ribosomal protein L7ae-like protein n=1 Tax=Spiroplasma endosymbiont of Labia minor TaxID=3066305 RepID=UPI0030D610FB
MNDKHKQFLLALGLANRGGKLIVGNRLIEEIKKNKVKLVIVCNDIGQAQWKKIFDKTSTYHVKVIKDVLTGNQLQTALGINYIKAIGILDTNMVKLIEDAYAKIIV